MEMKFIFEIRIVHKNSLALLGHHRPGFLGKKKASLTKEVVF